MHYVIVGNSVAGIEAAIVVRSREADARITLVSYEHDHPFARVSLMYLFCGQLALRDTELHDRDLYARMRFERVRDAYDGPGVHHFVASAGSARTCWSASLGSTVTLVSLDERVLPREDADAAAIVASALEEDGVRLRLGARIVRAMYDFDFLQLARAVGFGDPRTLVRAPISIRGEDVREKVGAARFASVTLRLFKPRGGGGDGAGACC